MTVLSKILMKDYALPYNCYELGHTWTPFCTEASITIANTVLKESLKMYSLLYFLTQFVLVRKFERQNFYTTFKSIIRSTSFLSFNALFTLSLFCFSRRLAGKFYLPLISHLPAALSSFAALKIERENRRSALAFYCANIAMETIIFGNLNIIDNKNKLIKMKKNDFVPIVTEALNNNFTIKILTKSFCINQNNAIKLFMSIFGVTSLIYLEEKKKTTFLNEHSNTENVLKKQNTDLVILAINFLLGEKMKKTNDKEKILLVDEKKELITEKNFLYHKIKYYFSNIFSFKHETSNSCLTNYEYKNCVKNFLVYFSRGFLIGWLSSSILLTGLKLKNNKLKLNESLFSAFKDKENLKFSLFLANFNGFFKLINCFLNKVDKKKSNWHSIISSVSSFLIPKILFGQSIGNLNLNLSQYVFWKAIENWFWFYANKYKLKKKLLEKNFSKLLHDELIIENKNINKNKNLNDQLGEVPCKINKLTVNDSIQLKKLVDDLTKVEIRKRFSIFNFVSADNLVSLVYALSVSQLFYVAVMQPQKLRGSYMKFLDRCTSNRLHLLNRSIIDFFGVQSSAGFKLYTPDLDYKYTSKKFQESVQNWMI